MSPDSDKLYINNSETAEPLICWDFSIGQVKISDDLEIQNNLDVGGNISSGGELTSNDSGSADMKVYAFGSIHYDGDIGTSVSSDGFLAERTTEN